MKVRKSLVLGVIYLVCFFSIHIVHNYFFNVDVVLYSALLDGVLASILTGLLIFLVPVFRKEFVVFERVLLVLISLMAGYMFAITVPAVIDRSLSFYILEKLQQRGGEIRYDKFEDVFTKEYMKEHHLVDIRITEQLSSHTITLENGIVKLTDWGKTLSTLSRFYRMNLLPKHRLLMGKYTDVLTDPFRKQ